VSVAFDRLPARTGGEVIAAEMAGVGLTSLQSPHRRAISTPLRPTCAREASVAKELARALTGAQLVFVAAALQIEVQDPSPRSGDRRPRL
jgi:hypothetical protein